MLVALCSDKGSPGTTTSALTLASAWPGPTLLVESDLFGGDLGVRLRRRREGALPEAPTVLTVAAASRTSTASDLASRHAHQFTRDLAVVPGHLSAEQAAGGVDWQALGVALAASSVPVFVDLGRVQAASPLVGVSALADLLVVVGRATPGSVVRLRERLNRLVPAVASHRTAPPGRRVRVYPLLVSSARHGRADVADVRRVLDDSGAHPFLAGAGFLAWDPKAVARLEAGEEPGGRLSRTELMRAADVVCQGINKLVEDTPDGAMREVEAAAGSEALRGGQPRPVRSLT